MTTATTISKIPISFLFLVFAQIDENKHFLYFQCEYMVCGSFWVFMHVKPIKKFYSILTFPYTRSMVQLSIDLTKTFNFFFKE